MTVEELQVIVTAQTAGLRSQLSDVTRQLQGMQRQTTSMSTSMNSAFSRIRGSLVKAFAVGAIIKFGKSCIDLGSDLTEVQNVVDVTFGSMSEDINKFAKNAMTQFGLSETAAKKYASTTGAILKSMGMSTGQAAQMSKTITGLAADMASFYNLSSDTAFEKIRSGLTGEVEPLRQLGINMSVANLEAYRMSQGISTAYANMTQQEQTLLRYNYLLSVTKDAQGDFARTSNSWANQTRILAMQFDALKAEIGQGLIAAFTPVVQTLNIVINKLRVAAGYFRAFMELVFGKQSSGGGGGVASVAADTSSIADSAGDAGKAVGGIGDAADKAGKKAAAAGKKAKGAVMSFDELNQLNKTDTGGSGGSGGGAGGGGGLENMGGAADVDLGNVEEGATKLDGLFNGLIEEAKHLKDLFAEGFKIGLGSDFQDKLDNIKKSIEGIGKSLKDIFTDNRVVAAAQNLVDSLALNAGKVAGSFLSVGATIAENLLGGLNKYLDQNKQYIKDRIVDIFNVSAEIADLYGDAAVVFADIFSVFGSDKAQQITADIITIFNNAFLGVTDLALRFGRDVLMCITQPIADNKDAIKQALMGAFDGIETITGTLSQMVTDTFVKAFDVYDQYIAPAFNRIEVGLSGLLEGILGFINTDLMPVFQGMANDVKTFYDEHLKQLIDKVLEGVGKLAEALSTIFTNAIVPIANFLINILGPYVTGFVSIVWDALKKIVTWVTDTLSDVMDIINGLLDFITGVFSGDWDKAWQGICDVVTGVFDVIDDVIFGVIETIVSWLWDTLVTAVTSVCESIDRLLGEAAEGMQILFGDALAKVGQFFTDCWTGIQNTWSGVCNWFSTTVIEPIKSKFGEWKTNITQLASEAWTGVTNAWNAATTWFSTNITAPIKGKFEEWKTNIGTIASQAWAAVKTGWSTATSWFSTSIATPIKTKLENAFNSIGQKGADAFTKVKNGCRSAVNGIIDHINSLIRKLNGIGFNLPDALGGGHVGFNIPTIPRLARGGIVDGSTFMGNYIAGEAGKEMIVPLENTAFTDKIASAMGQAVMNAMSVMLNSNGMNGQQGQNVSLEMDGVMFARTVTPYIVREMKRLGFEI